MIDMLSNFLSFANKPKRWRSVLSKNKLKINKVLPIFKVIAWYALTM